MKAKDEASDYDVDSAGLSAFAGGPFFFGNGQSLFRHAEWLSRDTRSGRLLHSRP